MTNEEFQKLVLEKLVSIESTTATKNELSAVDAKIDKLDAKIETYGQAQQTDIYQLLKSMDIKLDKHSEILKILSSRSIEQEAEISVLKRAK